MLEHLCTLESECHLAHNPPDSKITSLPIMITPNHTANCTDYNQTMDLADKTGKLNRIFGITSM